MGGLKWNAGQQHKTMNFRQPQNCSDWPVFVNDHCPSENIVEFILELTVSSMSFQTSNSRVLGSASCLTFPFLAGFRQFLELVCCTLSCCCCCCCCFFFNPAFYLPVGCSCLYLTQHITREVLSHLKRSPGPVPFPPPKTHS